MARAEIEAKIPAARRGKRRCPSRRGAEIRKPHESSLLAATATAEVVRYLGAEVTLVDVDEKTRTLDLEHAERRLTPNCKGIMRNANHWRYIQGGAAL
jgi:hypothetical protein